MKANTILFLIALGFSFPARAQHTFGINSWYDKIDHNIGDGICQTILGDCTLRAAIQEANATPNNGAIADQILFTNIPILAGFALIEVIKDPLPAITEKVFIDGTTAAGEVILEGSQITSIGLRPGLSLAVGSGGSTIKGLSIGMFKHAGIEIASNNNKIENNYIGVLQDGTEYGNCWGVGIYGGNNNTIGGQEKGNVIGLNECVGVYIEGGNDNRVRGNFVGTNGSGQNFGNEGYGISVGSGSSRTIIGGQQPALGNTIGFSESYGIVIHDSPQAVIRNNYIGTNAAGLDLGNGDRGIYINGSADTVGSHRIGGESSWGNTIGFNTNGGIYLFNVIDTKIKGNYIGTNRAGGHLGNDGRGLLIQGGNNNTVGYLGDEVIPPDASKANWIAYNEGSGVALVSFFSDPHQNVIRGNRIYQNGGAGIDLGNDGPTPNDDDDADTGPNALLNYPDVVRVDYHGGFDVVGIEYAISSDGVIVNYPLTVDVYIADDAASGQGKTHIGTDTYTTPEAVVIFDIDANSFTWASDDELVLTATDADGNTSEFSPTSEEIGGPGNTISFSADAQDRLSPTVRTRSIVSPVSLSPAYPNPFNPQTAFTLGIPEPAHIRITVHDALGRQVAQLHDGHLAAGLTHTFTFDAFGLASGMYLLRVESGQFIETKRLTLVK